MVEALININEIKKKKIQLALDFSTITNIIYLCKNTGYGGLICWMKNQNNS